MYVDDQTLTVNPSITPFPVTMTVKMPNEGTPAGVDLLIQGLDCSECAGGNGSGFEPTQACDVTLVPNTNPQEYRAAKPQWFGVVTQSEYVRTRNIGITAKYINVSNSCGCTVK